MMLLNSLDLLFCLSSTLVVITGTLYATNNHVLVISFSVFNFLFCVLLEGTAFVTCTLTITRTISLWCPFYEIKKKSLVIAILGFFVYVVGKGGLYLFVYHTNHPAFDQIGQTYDALGLISVSVMLALVTAATISSIVRLSRTSSVDLGWYRITENNREATVTVVILSGLFLVFNLGFVVVLSLQVLGCDPASGCLTRVLYEIGMQGIPINSAINPLVYFFRNRKMFKYLKAATGKIFRGTRCFSGCFTMFEFIAYLRKVSNKTSPASNDDCTADFNVNFS